MFTKNNKYKELEQKIRVVYVIVTILGIVIKNSKLHFNKKKYFNILIF